jgi:hypothetical protein
MYKAYYQTYANAVTAAAAEPLPLLNVFEPIVVVGELKSAVDCQFHYLEKADYRATCKKQKLSATGRDDEKGASRKEFVKIYHKYGYPLDKSLKGFEDQLESRKLRDRSAVSPVPPDPVRRFMKDRQDIMMATLPKCLPL